MNTSSQYEVELASAPADCYQCNLPRRQYYFTVGTWSIPAIVLPVVVCALYITWLFTLRRRFLASMFPILLDDKDASYLYVAVQGVSSREHAQTSRTQRLLRTVQEKGIVIFERARLISRLLPTWATLILGVASGIATIIGCWFAVGYLASCMGWRRVLFGLPPTAPKIMDAGMTAGVLAQCILLVLMYLDQRRMKRSPPLKLVVFRAIEAVPQTLIPLLSIAAVMFGILMYREDVYD